MEEGGGRFCNGARAFRVDVVAFGFDWIVLLPLLLAPLSLVVCSSDAGGEVGCGGEDEDEDEDERDCEIGGRGCEEIGWLLSDCELSGKS